MIKNVRGFKIQENKILLQLSKVKTIKLILKEFDIPVISVLCDNELQSCVLVQIQEVTMAKIFSKEGVLEIPLSQEIKNRIKAALPRLDAMSESELLTRASWIGSQVKYNKTLTSGPSQTIRVAY
jgi:hypothetical protein